MGCLLETEVGGAACPSSGTEPLFPWGPSVSLPAPNLKGQRDKDIKATAVTKFIFSSFFHTGGRNYIALGKFKQLHEHYTGTGNGHNGLTILHSKINNHFRSPQKSCKNNEDVQSDVQTLRCSHVPHWYNDVSLYLGRQRHRGGMGGGLCVGPEQGLGCQASPRDILQPLCSRGSWALALCEQ